MKSAPDRTHLSRYRGPYKIYASSLSISHTAESRTS